MNVIDRQQVASYLELACEISRSRCIIDAHVHASEIVFKRQGLAHPPNRAVAVANRIEAPRIGAIREVGDVDLCCIADAVRNRSSEAMFTAAYQSGGSVSLSAHMQVSHVQKALLLPVAPAFGPIDDQIEFLKGIRGNDPRFAIGYSLPRDVPTSDIAKVVRGAVDELAVKAVKLHPNLSGIDLDNVSERLRLYALLEACGDNGLPLVVHGGNSPILGGDAPARWASIQRLGRIDWGAGGGTVVIAHCGAYGCRQGEFASEIMPLLQTMLSKHERLAVDVSGLSSSIMMNVFKQIDHDRILFGSDALYSPMWRAVAVVMHAIELSGAPLKETFIRIACENPALRLRML